MSAFVIYISGHAVSAAPSIQETVINKPLPPKPGDNQNTNKKIYIAIYNFTPVEDGDLELQMVNKLVYINIHKLTFTLIFISLLLH